MASESYILALDGDEALSKELYAYLKSIKNDLKVAYRFPRKNNFYGKWMKSRAFYPDHKIRLFPKDKAQWHDSLVHEELIPHPDLEITEVKYDILHYTYKNIAEHQKHLDKYAKLASVRYRDQSKNKLWFKQYFNSSYRFIKNYLLQYAFIDGSAGFTASYLNAKEVYLKYKYARVAK